MSRVDLDLGGRVLVHVLRCFDDPNVVHVDGSVNPIRDKETIDTELQLKDLDIQEGEDFFAAIVAVRMNTRVNERIQNILLKRQLNPLTIGVHLNRCEPVSFGWNNAVSLYLDTNQNTQITTVRGKGLLTDFATRHLREQIGLVSAVGMYASVGRFFEEHPEVLSL